MPIVTFVGRVLPESIPFSLWFGEPVNWHAYGMLMKLHAVIDQSKIRVDCELPEFRSEYLGFLYRAAYDLVRVHVDLVSFSGGFGWIVLIETFIDPDGNKIPLFVLAGSLAAECTAFKMNFHTPEESEDFMMAARAVITEPALLYALNDLIETLTKPSVAPVNCGRVLDRLRKIVAPNEKKPVKGWTALQGIVNVDQQFIEWVSKISTDPRHGDWSKADEAEIKEAVRRCWVVMNRFIEYRKRGNQPLPLDKFPLLCG
jgi:hypothetical protein